ncbi:T9SS C-terminal target domain-containing protein [Flavobacterium circumlabens]|uniref:Secreted protein (Por secretion system target) n=1 Tax=Flavobacterium circumlabens TaxID=2133765 RepID=A0A4Y7UEC2_9FLAO|nr:family 16 glycosylhydrolase [Flavobacterium circumlabens]TCN59518.1 putative secreted protein (Por secretion system target) [Flavobacterium circumlabens]TEB44810.1 T9SS C-terminal target domain-containing protein [Flavobacterium circumlabens]
MRKILTFHRVKAIFYTLSCMLLFNLSAKAQNYQLVWSDEFNGTGAPDNSKWSYELGGNLRNSELQYYTNSTNNIKQNAGNLEITVIKEAVGGKQYTSGSITTLNKASWTYGKIEGRLKMPKGQGLWAAFWTLGTNYASAGWPKSGEIDIMEHINSETIIHGTAHYGGLNDVHVQNANTYSVDVTQWHTYSVVWDANYIKWYVDDVLFHQLQITGGQNYTEEFHLPQYILINLPIGGSWPGSPDATTVLPATMYCDYIRVYKNIDTTPVPVSSISISPASANVALNGSQTLKTSFVPANATNLKLTWTSNNNAVANVDNLGVVTGVSVGSAIITATTEDGNKTSISTISVQNLVGVNKLVNGNFDSDVAIVQKPAGWLEYSGIAGGTANALNSNTSPHSANYNGIQSATGHYEVAVYQTFTNLANGIYTAKAWVRSSGGQSKSVFYGKTFGSDEINYNLAISIPTWTQIQLNNILVSNNSYEIGFYQWTGTGAASTWLEYDDIEFYLSATGTLGVTNPSQDFGIQNFTAYPNPVKSGNILNISANDGLFFDIFIVDINGRKVYSQLNNTSNLTALQLPNLDKGIYFLRTTSATKTRIQKILIE